MKNEMTPRERFWRVMTFQTPDRHPHIEWAPLWDKTRARWNREGADASLSDDELLDSFGLERFPMIGASPAFPPSANPDGYTREEYRAARAYAYGDEVLAQVRAQASALAERHARGDFAVRVWLDGFFWLPRRLMGIERHFLSFYDEPEFLHEICEDLAAFDCRAADVICDVFTPEVFDFAEDMSYNGGPMLSGEMFETFLAPYYRRVVPQLHTRETVVFVDTDGDVKKLILWLLSVGIDGIFPLERQAGVDVAELRREFPTLRMLGGFDKMVMSRGDEAVRAEFERLRPVVESGGYLLSVDHQTPPEVSLAQYRAYLEQLFRL